MTFLEKSDYYAKEIAELDWELVKGVGLGSVWKEDRTLFLSNVASLTHLTGCYELHTNT